MLSDRGSGSAQREGGGGGTKQQSVKKSCDKKRKAERKEGGAGGAGGQGVGGDTQALAVFLIETPAVRSVCIYMSKKVTKDYAFFRQRDCFAAQYAAIREGSLMTHALSRQLLGRGLSVDKLLRRTVFTIMLCIKAFSSSRHRFSHADTPLPITYFLSLDS